MWVEVSPQWRGIKLCIWNFQRKFFKCKGGEVVRQFNTDCEGPIVLNDNALELSAHFIPHGEDFFIRLSKYDDYLAEIVRKPGYRPGGTLSMILPFLKVFGATNKKIEYYSLYHIKLVPGAIETYKYIQNKMPLFLVSTSYSPFALALGEKLGVTSENVYCTKLDLDQYEIDASEVVRLKELVKEILYLPIIEFPPDATSPDYLSPQMKATIHRLDQIIWQEVMTMKCGRALHDVNPIGGIEKAKAVEDSVEKAGSSLSDVIYLGDSITDADALRLVKENGGVAVSFNGNSYAIEAAEIACISSHAIVSAILADVFLREGKEGVMYIASNWSPVALRESTIDERLVAKLFSEFQDDFPVVKVITNAEKDKIIQQSEAFRGVLRGKAGTLG
jgi:energy-converting hydrogenase A subunit R